MLIPQNLFQDDVPIDGNSSTPPELAVDDLQTNKVSGIKYIMIMMILWARPTNKCYVKTSVLLLCMH